MGKEGRGLSHKYWGLCTIKALQIKDTKVDTTDEEGQFFERIKSQLLRVSTSLTLGLIQIKSNSKLSWNIRFKPTL
jgi:hypothetical protein